MKTQVNSAPSIWVRNLILERNIRSLAERGIDFRCLPYIVDHNTPSTLEEFARIRQENMQTAGR